MLFVKLPEKGRVKSRLARDTDPEFAVKLYENTVLDTVDAIAPGRPLHIFFSPADALRGMQAWLGRERSYQPQTGDDLGKRMEHAFIRVFADGVERAVLVGGDIPGLTRSLIDEAFGALENHDAVIGPANDGGYYLIGFGNGAFPPAVFHDMIWSTDTVFRETLIRLRQASCSVHVLPAMTDMDTIDDVRSLFGKEMQSLPASSRTRLFLEKHWHRFS